MSIVNPKYYIQSARNNGYKDTAYAIAEIADNSIQADSNFVKVIIVLEDSNKIDEIIIADNGTGMTKERLSMALSFGESGREKDKNGKLLGEDTLGMGKFGMGLPNASVSQCKRVEVYSWQETNKPFYSYLDIDEINNNEFTELPEVVTKDVPAHLKSIFNNDFAKESGTIVKWSKLDKLRWKRANTLFEKSEFEIGRMYRRFIAENQIKVKFTVLNSRGDELVDVLNGNGFVKPNDPMFLTEDARINPDIEYIDGENKFPFVEFESTDNQPFIVDFKGEKHEIKIKTSYLRPEVCLRINKNMEEDKVGSTEFGRHCLRNFGISVMRSNREIEMLTNEFFAKDDKNQSRFIGVEIEIPPALDEVFGVTNNKQHAHDLKDLKDQKFYDGKEQLTTYSKIINYLKSEGDEEGLILYQTSYKLNSFITNVKKQIKGLRLTKNHTSAELTEDDQISSQLTTQKKKREKALGHFDEIKPDYQKYKAVLIEQKDVEPENAEKIVEKLELQDSVVDIRYQQAQDDVFFDVELIMGMITLTINTEHPAYKEFCENKSPELQRMFKLLLGSWAIFEGEQTVSTLKRKIEVVRNDWSKIIHSCYEDI